MQTSRHLRNPAGGHPHVRAETSAPHPLSVVTGTVHELTAQHPSRYDEDYPPAPRADVEALPALIPVPDVAKLLGLARSSAYKLAATGELPAKRLGGRVYIVRAGLREFLETA